MKAFFAIIFTILLIITGVFHFSRSYTFNRDIGDWLKLAADAPSVERADEFLGHAISEIDDRDLTDGNSAYIFDQPSTDIGIWYSQIQGAKQTTASILERVQNDSLSVTQLERDNALMKIREVLLDQGESGTDVTLPKNITIFPFQWLFLISYLVTLIIAAACWIAAVQEL